MTQTQSLTVGKIDWAPLVNSIEQMDSIHLPTYPGDLKTALVNYAGLANDGQGEAMYQLAVEISHLTTCTDLEITYWFSRLVALIDSSN